MEVTILGSGSAGNCTLIETESTTLLVDAGLSARQITTRLHAIGRNITDVDGILLTHEHSDHTGALGVLCRSTPLPVYANRLTAEALTENAEWKDRTRPSWRLFATGSAFAVGDLEIENFTVPHDAADPVGFCIHQRPTGHSIGVLTDLGHATHLVLERVRNVDALILEANHDVKLLQDDTARPWATKQRILSRHGHLSNDAAATAMHEIASDRCRHVFLVHLSRDCNRPELAKRTVADKLRQAGAHHITVEVSTQETPTPTLKL